MGTGTSIGVPVVGCDCAVCQSGDAKNQRLRSGVLVRAPEGEFVVDTGPELRLQLLQNQATFIQAALFTHAHADHVMGLDDLRIFGFRKERMALEAAEARALAAGIDFDPDTAFQENPGNIPLYCEQPVEDSIRKIFHYAFTDPNSHSHRYATPRLAFERMQPNQPLQVLGMDVLILDALRVRPHPTHLSVSQAVKWAERLKPKQTYLTHMSHDLDYHQLAQDLPDGIAPAYDGLTIPIAATGN